MTMLKMKIPPPALAVLAVGALWYFTQRRAVAATVSTARPIYGTEGALQAASVQRYAVAPSGITPAAASPLQAVLQFATGLLRPGAAASSAGAISIDRMDQAYSMGGPSTGVYGVDQALVRAADYVPTYTPDTQGEAAAQAYYASNPDEFISNPPSLYQVNNGVDPYGGWADRQ